VLWELDFNEDSHAPAFGTLFREGEVVCYLQTQHGIEALKAFENSRLVAIDKQQGQKVTKGDAICWLEKAEIIETKDERQKTKDEKPKAKADTKVIPAKQSNWKKGKK
jgi:hypothetical protein